MVEDELLAQCRTGNDAAFRALYYRTMPRVRVWVGRLLGPRPSVSDVVQDVFMQVHRSLGTFRGDAAFSTWLYRLTLHVVTTHLRQHGRSERYRSFDQTAEETCQSDEGRVLAREQLRRLYEALDALAIEKRVVFVLYELEGHTLREIAELTGTRIPTVAARLRRARLALVASFDPNIAVRRAESAEG